MTNPTPSPASAAPGDAQDELARKIAEEGIVYFIQITDPQRGRYLKELTARIRPHLSTLPPAQPQLDCIAELEARLKVSDHWRIAWKTTSDAHYTILMSLSDILKCGGADIESRAREVMDKNAELEQRVKLLVSQREQLTNRLNEAQTTQPVTPAAIAAMMRVGTKVLYKNQDWVIDRVPHLIVKRNDIYREASLHDVTLAPAASGAPPEDGHSRDCPYPFEVCNCGRIPAASGAATPETADGVPIVLGAELWFLIGGEPESCRLRDFPADPKAYYSTREAAIESRRMTLDSQRRSTPPPTALTEAADYWAMWAAKHIKGKLFHKISKGGYFSDSELAALLRESAPQPSGLECRCNCHQPWWVEEGHKPHRDCIECQHELLDELERLLELAYDQRDLKPAPPQPEKLAAMERVLREIVDYPFDAPTLTPTSMQIALHQFRVKAKSALALVFPPVAQPPAIDGKAVEKIVDEAIESLWPIAERYLTDDGYADHDAICDMRRDLTAIVNRILAGRQESYSGVGIDRIQRERGRQISKGFDADHDDQHTKGEIAEVAEAILHTVNNPGHRLSLMIGTSKPSDPQNWHLPIIRKWRHDPIRMLEIAGAMIAAEIERRSRILASATAGNSTKGN